MFYIIVFGILTGLFMNRAIEKFVHFDHYFRSIGAQNIVMSLCTATLFLCVYAYPKADEPMYLQYLIVSIYICIAIIDIKYMIIPDQLNVLLAVTSIVVVFVSAEITRVDAIAGLIAGAGIMTIIAMFGPVGGGDIKCMAALGLGLGLIKTLYLIFLAFLMAGVVSGILLVFKVVKRTDRIPFGPFILASAFAVNYFYSEIISVYVALLL